jgi:hypothetical protein
MNQKCEGTAVKEKTGPGDVSAAPDLPRATVASGVPPKAMRGGISHPVVTGLDPRSRRFLTPHELEVVRPSLKFKYPVKYPVGAARNPDWSAHIPVSAATGICP